MSLLRELMRLYHSGERAMLCALSHGQVSIDGYVIGPQHLERWSEGQLRGRYAVLRGRPPTQLYGTTPVNR